jgi:hypothetical protein
MVACRRDPAQGLVFSAGSEVTRVHLLAIEAMREAGSTSAAIARSSSTSISERASTP